jgi:hypothetical protein
MESPMADSSPPLDPAPAVAAVPAPVPAVAGAAAPAPAGGAPLWRTVLKVAWLSIGLGLALEVLLLVVAAYGGTAGDSPKPFVADLVRKVSWSLLVCVGIAFGTAAGKARSAAMGLLGLVSAPVAFNAAKALHKGTASALGVAAGAAAGPSPLLIAALKALEYGLLGAAVGLLGKRGRGTLGAHVGVGLSVGAVFGGAILGASAAAGAATDLVSLLAAAINEVLFPVGCSLVLYASGTIGKRLG